MACHVAPLNPPSIGRPYAVRIRCVKCRDGGRGTRLGQCSRMSPGEDGTPLSTARCVIPDQERHRAGNGGRRVCDPVVHAESAERDEKRDRARRAPGRGLRRAPLDAAVRADDGGDRPDQPEHG